MASIICSIPQLQDATSLYRGVGPFQSLHRSDNVHVSFRNDLSWVTLKGADAVFFQRPALDDRLAMMRLCRANNKPIWLDYDDNLHAIPMCNRRYPLFGTPHVQHNIATMVAMADVISVTTQHLGEALAGLLKCFPNTTEFRLNPEKIKVIPNAYDSDLHPPLDEKRSPREKLVVWRGSDSHSKDLMLHTEQLQNVVRKHQAWNYEFIGEPFWWTIEQLKKVAKPAVLGLTAAQDPVLFFRYLYKQRPSLVIVPLEERGFNRSKSNIAWIEATAAGAVTLAPAWPEWQKPGVLTYDGADDFERKMNSVIEGDYNTDALWQESRDYIREHLPLNVVNRARMEILEGLCKR